MPPAADAAGIAADHPVVAPATESAANVPFLVGRAAQMAANPRIQTYDFRNPAFLSEAEIRRLQGLHEDFARHAAARLSLYLRMDLDLKLAQFTTLPYSKFTDSFPSPTHVNLFKAEPLVGVGLLDLPPRLALAIADRLLGGRGQCGKADRYLTEIEVALIEDVIQILVEEWSAQWSPEQDLRPVIIGHENNGRFLQTSARGAIMLAAAIECRMADCTEQIHVGVPYFMIEPVLKRMHARRHKDATAAAGAKRAEWQPVHETIMVPVRAEWEAFDLPIREVASLRVGDVLELPASICAEARVLLSGSAKFLGTAGLDGGRVAVQLTRKLSPEDSSHAKPVGRKDA